MSARIKFDLDGLSRAIETSDSHYLLALYADNAIVHLIDSDDPASSRILQGKRAIADWIEYVCAPEISRRVLSSIADESRVALAEECRTPDGASIWYAYTAEVNRGQIVRETVTATARPGPLSGSPDAWTSQRRFDPIGPLPTGQSRRSATASAGGQPDAQAGDRNLAGNFFG